MAHNSNHRDLPVQKAGQAVRAALPLQSTLSHDILCTLRFSAVFHLSRKDGSSQDNTRSCGIDKPLTPSFQAESAERGISLRQIKATAPEILNGGAVRVAGGELLSKKTSTAARVSCRDLLPIQRRAPRHPRAFIGPAFRGGPLFKRNSQEDAMNTTPQFPGRSFKSVLHVIFRITLSLLLWTLGAAAMDIHVTPIPPKEHRVIFNFPIDRAKAENLQSWVNAGHDSWCRDPQFVASETLRRISPELGDFEPASLPLELEHNTRTKAVYAFHSLDGRSTYRITLRRYLYLLPAAGSLHRVIWIPESAEFITRDVRD